NCRSDSWQTVAASALSHSLRAASFEGRWPLVLAKSYPGWKSECSRNFEDSFADWSWNCRSDLWQAVAASALSRSLWAARFEKRWPLTLGARQSVEREPGDEPP